ncbi:hypothetical protein EC988_000755 [Linderina pennispora]|nr:hypothetical protein EC988_000755 [Linderina pennispora]
MFTNGPSSSTAVARARSLIGSAKQQGSCEQAAAIELQQIIDGFVDGIDITTGDGQRIEVFLMLCTEMLDAPNVCPLCECGIRSIFTILSKALLGASDTEPPDTAVFRAQVVDLCIERTYRVYEEACSVLEKASTSASSADTQRTADAVRLALLMTDSVCSLVSSLSGAIASQRIWSSGQSDTPPLAMALVKWFEVACQLSKTSTTPTMRKTASLAGNITELAKSAGTLVESISSSLTTDAHLSQDLGMKRAVLERFCEYVLTAYRSFLSQPQHFKAIWKALCRTATRFAPPSFAGGRLCLRVFSESCSMISVLTQQTAGILAKSLSKDLVQRTVAHRIMNSLAFVRFFMFHMSALLKRMHSDPSVDDTAAFQHAMPMFDDVLGSLVTPHNMAFMPGNIADNMHNLVLAVAEKVVVAMFSHSVKELVSYVDTVHAFAADRSSRCSYLPLLTGLKRPVANIEVLRMVLSNIDSFSAHQQSQLLARHKSLVSALALAVDRDPTSILAALDSAASSAISERVSLSTAYEQLVSSVAVSAIKVATPGVFELWEIAAFDVLSWSSPGSLGACIVADAWIIVARNALPSALVVSTMDSVIDIAYSAPESISDMARSRFATLFDGFVQGISQDDLTAWLARLIARFDNQSASIGLVYAMVPWSVFTDSGALLSIRKAAQQIRSATGCAAIVAATGLALAGTELGAAEVGQSMCSFASQLLSRSLNAAGEASIVGCILAMAVSLAQSDLAFPASVLSECSSHICSQNGKAFDSHPASAVMLGLLCGCFAETDLEQPLLLPVGKAVKPVFAFLLDSARPWMVRHFAHRQLIRFAMDEHNAHIVEAVATGSAEQALLQFIQKVPAGKPIANGEQGHVYRAVFDINVPKESLISEDSGISGLLEAISRLRQELAATKDMTLDQDDACLLRGELGKLASDITRFS